MDMKHRVTVVTRIPSTAEAFSISYSSPLFLTATRKVLLDISCVFHELLATLANSSRRRYKLLLFRWSAETCLTVRYL